MNGKRVTWSERLIIIRSKAFAEAKIKAFERQLARVEKELVALTPAPGRGKRQFKERAPLQQKLEEIVSRFEVELERRVKRRQVRGYKGKPDRIEEKVRYQVHLRPREQAIEPAKFRLAWRVYATNAPTPKLNLSDAVLVYRGQYLGVGDFGRLKGPLLKLLPLYVQRDDHALGLIRLLTLALRALTIIEFVAQRSLAQEEEEALSGVYQGNPKRQTRRPSAGLLLAAFDNISLVVHYNDAGAIAGLHLTPLSQSQQRILRLLGLSPEIYDRLLGIPVLLPLPQQAQGAAPVTLVARRPLTIFDKH